MKWKFWPEDGARENNWKGQVKEDFAFSFFFSVYYLPVKGFSLQKKSMSTPAVFHMRQMSNVFAPNSAHHTELKL